MDKVLERSGVGPDLTPAAGGGHEKDVYRLLEWKNADRDTTYELGGAPFLWVPEGIREGIVQMLFGANDADSTPAFPGLHPYSYPLVSPPRPPPILFCERIRYFCPKASR